VTYNNFCGSISNLFVSEQDALSTPTAAPVSSYLWTLQSATGTYCFNTVMTFSNYPDSPITTDSICTDWRQACYIEATVASFNSFTPADNNTDTEAGFNLTIAGEIMGDCGEGTTATASMTGDDGSVYDFTISNDFYAAGGQSIYQEVSRDVVSYTLVVSMDADVDAESVAHHQNRTSGDGYNNVLSSMINATTTSTLPVCALSAHSIEWVSYEEIDEWRSNILATYKGVVRAEESCTDL
jgi:hypothetical protein